MRKMFIVALFWIAGALLLSSSVGFPHRLLGAMSTLVSAQGDARRLPGRRDGDERERRFLQSRLIGEKKITSDDYDEALRQWNRLPRVERSGGKERKAQNVALTTLTGTIWKPVGPMPLLDGAGFVAGRVHAIAINPNNPNVIYVGMNIG